MHYLILLVCKGDTGFGSHKGSDVGHFVFKGTLMQI